MTMKPNVSKSFKEAAASQLHQNYGILHQLLPREQFESFKYEQLIYMLLNGRIEMEKISYWKQKKYRSQQPLMRKSFIIQDSIKLKEEVVGKAWRFEKTTQPAKILNPNKNTHQKARRPAAQATQKQDFQQTNVNKTQELQQCNQQKFKNKIQQQTQQPSLQSSPSPPQRHARSLTTKKQKNNAKNEELKLKRVKIEDMMTNLQAKMNVTRNQAQAAKYQKQYNQCFKELTDLRNRKRIQRENSLIQRVGQQNGRQIGENLRNIIQKMNIIKQNKSKILDKQPEFKQKISKAEQINRLNLIFAFYCKKQTENTNKYFSDIHKSYLALNLQTFIRFVQDWKLARIVTMEQIINIFKSHSKGKKSIDSFQFNQVLADVHKCECIKEEKEINGESISQYIQEYVVEENKIKNKILGYVTHNQQQNKRYNFKPKSHSGKYLQDIKQQIEERKQTVQFLAGPQNIIKYKKQSKSRSRMNSQVAQNSRLDTRTLSSSSLSPTQKQAPFVSSSLNSLNDSLNSYAFRFKLKNTKSRIKTEGIIKSIQNTKQYKNSNNGGGFTINVLQSNRENISHRRDNNLNEDEETSRYDVDDLMTKQGGRKQKKNPIFEGFEDLIEESEEDQYLSKHLQLPPIKASKAPSRSIHY